MARKVIQEPISLSEELTGKVDTPYSPKKESMSQSADLDTMFPFDDVPHDDEGVDLDTSGNNNSGSYIPPSLDEIDATAPDHESMAKAKAELFLPTGEYIWVDKPDVKPPSFLEKDKKRGDVSVKGRCFINLFGKVESKDGLYTDYFRVSLSPDERKQKDSDGNALKKSDMFYQLWMKACDLYYDIYEEVHSKNSDIVHMLETGSYYMYITLGKKRGGNFLNGFKIQR